MPHTTPTRAGAAPSPMALPVIMLAVFLVPLGIAGTGIVLPSIARDLGSQPFQLQSVVNGFNAAFAIFAIVWGVLSDRLGYRATVVLGLAAFAVGSILSATAPHLLVLNVGRILAGVGGAAVFAGAAALMSNAWEGAARARNFAIFGTTMGIGSASGPVLAGLLTDWLGWRGVYIAFGLIALLAIAFARALPFVKHERVYGGKAVDFTLLRSPHFLAMALVPVVSAVGVVTMATYLPVAYSAIYGLSAARSGIFMLFMMGPIVIAPLAVARLLTGARNVTPMQVIYASLGLIVLGDVALWTVSPAVSMWWAVPGMLLIGAGFGLTIGLVDGEALTAVPANRSGAAAGVLNFMRLGSEAVVLAAFAAGVAGLISGRISNGAVAERVAAGLGGHPDAYAAALHVVLVIMIVGNLGLGAVIALLHRARIRQSPDDSHPEPVVASNAV